MSAGGHSALHLSVAAAAVGPATKKNRPRHPNSSDHTALVAKLRGPNPTLFLWRRRGKVSVSHLAAIFTCSLLPHRSGSRCCFWLLVRCDSNLGPHVLPPPPVLFFLGATYCCQDQLLRGDWHDCGGTAANSLRHKHFAAAQVITVPSSYHSSLAFSILAFLGRHGTYGGL